ncbi:MAG TPA: DRTGG domain-containing protein [Anaerolineaceae bacterium]|nr:DRTGG domain-containing protein [Anaerolineaceae bacterium]
MKISELINQTQGKLLTKESSLDPDEIINGGCSADLMSDVLAYIQPHAVLLTGLVNPQVVRTAQMSDVAAIVFVRGKIPPEETIQLAEEVPIPLISSPLGMYELSGRLYQMGLPSLENAAKE